MTDKVQKIRKEVEKLKSNLIYGACSSQIAMETMCKEEAYNEVLSIIDSMQEETTTLNKENSTPLSEVGMVVDSLQQPKFKIGDTIIHIDDGADVIYKEHKVINVAKLGYVLDNGRTIELPDQDQWELVERKPLFKQGDMLYKISDGSKIEIIDIVADQYKFECGDEFPHYEFFGYIENNYSKELVNRDLNKEIQHWREHYIKVKECGFQIDLRDIEAVARHFANWQKEEPVSEVWHDANEEQPEEYRTVVVWNPTTMDGAVLTRCVEVYKGRIWAYIEDLLNLSNVQRTGKDWNEPVSEELEEAANNALSNVLNAHEIVNVRSCLEMFKSGANWQKKRDYITLSDDINEVAEQICNKVLNCEIDYKEDDVVLSDEEECVKAGIRWQMQKESIPSKDLEELINSLSKRYPEVSFAKLSRIAVRVAKWQKENLWKPADGDDLPEIDREVIALTQPYPNDEHLRVVFAHRPNKYAKIWNSDLGEEQVVEIERHGKGEWNIPNVKYWLDCSLPNVEED